jgi:hypothetical protein
MGMETHSYWKGGAQMRTTMQLRLRLARAGRRLVVLGAMSLLALGAAVGIGAPQAAALGTGTACMINAPSGATAGPVNFGHVGWAFQEGGTSRWFSARPKTAEEAPTSHPAATPRPG